MAKGSWWTWRDGETVSLARIIAECEARLEQKSGPKNKEEKRRYLDRIAQCGEAALVGHLS
ncbi:MAG: hypothetical protein ACK2UA_05835 [Anaerolineae bacterium]